MTMHTETSSRFDSNSKPDSSALLAPQAATRSINEAYIVPTQMVHFQLLEIWEELFAVRPIGIRDNFFSLGGNSLLAAHLVERFEQVFKKKMSLATFCAGPTIEQLAKVLTRREESNSRAPVVPVQTGGTRRPFFYLPGDWSNGAFYCYKLAQHLGPDQPFYVVERYSFDGLQVLPPFQTMVAEYVKSIQAIQPEGPYILGGFCHGALEAYEMARQLQEAGEVVDLLILCDPGTPAPIKSTWHMISRFGKLVGLSQEKQLDVFLLLRHVRKYLRYRYKYLRDAHYRRVLQGIEIPGTGANIDVQGDRYEMGLGLPKAESFIPPVEVLRSDWSSLFLWIAADYEPARFKGKIAISWSKQEFAGREKWYEKTDMKNIDLQVIPGGHMTCRTKYLAALAEHLRECLNRMQVPEPGQGR